MLLTGAAIDNASLSWKRLIPALAPHHRVYALDWPKQGQSRPWNGIADHHALLQCVAIVLDHFGVEKANLVGLSQGGAIALAFALSRPERVERLVAIAPAGIIRFPVIVHQLMWLAARLSGVVRAVSTPVFRNRKAVEWIVRTSLFAGPSPDFDDVVDGILEEAAHGVGASDWQNHSIGFLQMQVDLMPQLHQITCPVLFIQGDKDVAVKPKYTIEAARRVPDSQLVLLENHGHWPNRQSPELVNAHIADFLRP